MIFEVDLRPGEHKTVEIPVDPHDSGHGLDAYLVVTLVTEQGIPLATSNIWLEGQGQTLAPHFDTDDSKSFMGEPGMYTLCAHYPGFRPVRMPVELISRHEGAARQLYQTMPITMVRQ